MGAANFAALVGGGQSSPRGNLSASASDARRTSNRGYALPAAAAPINASILSATSGSRSSPVASSYIGGGGQHDERLAAQVPTAQEAPPTAAHWESFESSLQGGGSPWSSDEHYAVMSREANERA